MRLKNYSSVLTFFLAVWASYTSLQKNLVVIQLIAKKFHKTNWTKSLAHFLLQLKTDWDSKKMSLKKVFP